MKSYNLIYGLLIFAAITPLQSQSNIDYFPHKTGDMWEYLYAAPPQFDTMQIFTIYDSVDISGNIYLIQTQRYINPITPVTFYFDTMNYRIDNLNQVWGRVFEEEDAIAYKLNGQQGDKWIVENHGSDYIMARIRTIGETQIFGNSYLYMNTYYYLSPDTSDTLGYFDIYSTKLAKGLGLFWKGGGESSGEIYLKGAVINGVLYGDTTQIITSVFDEDEFTISNDYKISQNYPNPFNPNTNIDFEITEQSVVSLKIFDISGKLIETVVENKYYPVGKYTLRWTPGKENISSGVYFYQFTINNKYLFTKAMLYLK